VAHCSCTGAGKETACIRAPRMHNQRDARRLRCTRPQHAPAHANRMAIAATLVAPLLKCIVVCVCQAAYGLVCGAAEGPGSGARRVQLFFSRYGCVDLDDVCAVSLIPMQADANAIKYANVMLNQICINSCERGSSVRTLPVNERVIVGHLGNGSFRRLSALLFLRSCGQLCVDVSGSYYCDGVLISL